MTRLKALLRSTRCQVERTRCRRRSMTALGLCMGMLCLACPPSCLPDTEPLAHPPKIKPWAQKTKRERWNEDGQHKATPYDDYLVHQGIYVTFDQGIGEPALLNLLTHQGMQTLKSIAIHGQRITARAVEAIMHAEATQELDSLFLSGSHIGDEGLKALAASPRLAQIEYLVLQDVNATGVGAAALATSPYLRPKSLSMGFQNVGDTGAQALSNASEIGSLTLDSAQIGTQGLVALLEGRGARALSLKDNPGGLKGLRTVSPTIQGLSLNGLTHADVQALARVPAPSLTTLSIERSNLLDDSVKAIMAAPWFGQLQIFSLSAQRASPGSRRALIKAFKGEFLSVYTRDLNMRTPPADD